MRKALAILMTFLFLAMSSAGCTRKASTEDAPQEVPTLDIYMTNGYKYAPMRVLEDEVLRSQLEKTLGAKICIHYRDVHQDSALFDTGEINGVILTDDPISIQTLADNNKINSLENASAQMTDSVYGRYRGLQYGYVFTKGKHIISPLLVVDKEKLEQAGIKKIPYTPDAWLEALRKLKLVCSEPMAVYGAPTEPSYAPLFAMFHLSPRGGTEFNYGTDSAEYDKLSSSAREYLSYINTLYREGLLPKNMLSMNCYSAGRKMLNNVSAVTVFYDEAYFYSFREYAKKNGVRIACAEIPFSTRYLESGMDNRLLGLITKNYANSDLAKRLFVALDMLSLSVEFSDKEMDMEKYPLFEEKPISTTPYSAGVARKDINILYQSVKRILDDEYIIPYYCQIAVGEKDISAFDTMCLLWRESSVNMISDSINGDAILNYYLD